MNFFLSSTFWCIATIVEWVRVICERTALTRRPYIATTLITVALALFLFSVSVLEPIGIHVSDSLASPLIFGDNANTFVAMDVSRTFTYVLVHESADHLLFNSLYLYVFARQVENRLTRPVIFFGIVLCLISGVPIGNYFHDTPVIGMSGITMLFVGMYLATMTTKIGLEDLYLLPIAFSLLMQEYVWYWGPPPGVATQIHLSSVAIGFGGVMTCRIFSSDFYKRRI